MVANAELSNGSTHHHNLYGEIAAELGLLEIVAVTDLIGDPLRRALEVRKDSGLASVAAIAACAFTGQQFSNDLTNQLFWIGVIPLLVIDSIHLKSASGHIHQSNSVR